MLKWSKATPFGNLGSVKATVQEGVQCATGGSRNSPQLNTLRTNPARKSGDEERKLQQEAKAMRVEVLATKEFPVAGEE